LIVELVDVLWLFNPLRRDIVKDVVAGLAIADRVVAIGELIVGLVAVHWLFNLHGLSVQLKRSLSAVLGLNGTLERQDSPPKPDSVSKGCEAVFCFSPPDAGIGNTDSVFQSPRTIGGYFLSTYRIG